MSWSGRAVTRARAQWAPQLPVPCCRCRLPVMPRPWLPHDGWQVDHWPTPRALGGTDTWPAHSDCNAADGGRLGAAITNARKATRSTGGMTPERDRGIRGI